MRRRGIPAYTKQPQPQPILQIGSCKVSHRSCRENVLKRCCKNGLQNTIAHTKGSLHFAYSIASRGASLIRVARVDLTGKALVLLNGIEDSAEVTFAALNVQQKIIHDVLSEGLSATKYCPDYLNCDMILVNV